MRICRLAVLTAAPKSSRTTKELFRIFYVLHFNTFIPTLVSSQGSMPISGISMACLKTVFAAKTSWTVSRRLFPLQIMHLILSIHNT